MAICLNMIVRNEAQNLERLFASVYRYIDYYVISDTGSEDDTVDMIAALGRLYGVPGEVVQHTWHDFASNRQLALEAAVEARNSGRHGCFHLLFLDADEELVVTDKQWLDTLKPGISYTAYRKLGGIAFRRLLLAWVDDVSWRWRGEIHENLQRGTSGQNAVFLTAVYVRCHELQGYNFRRFGSSSGRTRNDIMLLEKELRLAVPQKRDAHRFFQYALALRDDGRVDDALVVLRRIVSEETIQGSYRYMSMVQAARIMLQAGRDFEEALQLLKDAISERPQRKEAYYYLAAALSTQGMHDQALQLLEQGLSASDHAPGGYAYTEEDIGKWKLAYERCLLLYRIGRFREALTACEHLLDVSDLPDIEYGFILKLKSRIVSQKNQDPLNGNDSA